MLKSWSVLRQDETCTCIHMASDGTSGTPEHTAQQRKCSEMKWQNLSSNLDPGPTIKKRINRLSNSKYHIFSWYNFEHVHIRHYNRRSWEWCTPETENELRALMFFTNTNAWSILIILWGGEYVHVLTSNLLLSALVGHYHHVVRSPFIVWQHFT